VTIRRVSNSEIQTFKRCRRQWWLAWHRGLRPKVESPLGALAIGQNIHVALGGWYVPDGQPRTNPQETLEVLLKEAAERLGTYWGSQEKNVPPEELKILLSEADLQRIMLEGYMQWIEETGADQDFTIIESERYVEAPFIFRNGVQIYIIGRLDVLAEDHWSKQLVFIDHKTTGSILESLKGIAFNPQMRMYRLILQLAEDRDVLLAIYSMLRKVKRTVKANPPFFHREKIVHNRHEIESFIQQLMGVIYDIIEVEYHLNDVYTHPNMVHNRAVYPTPGAHCRYCPFQRECLMMDDGSRAEDSLASRFTAGEPLHYYGRDDLARLQPGSRPVDPHPRRIEAG
jgi:hypothetical protein